MSQLQNSAQENWILIPFHSQRELLQELLVQLTSSFVLVVDDSAGLLNDIVLPKHVYVLKNKGRSSFANSVNVGLEYLEQKGIQKALILNDDAQISPEAYQQLFLQWKEKLLISPVIFQQGMFLYGIGVKDWGRVVLLREKKSPDALLGTCLLLPTELRFDPGFPHGFEDIELSLRAKQQGYTLRVIDTVVCNHLGEATLSRKQKRGQRAATYGHLRLFSSRKTAPIIAALSFLQILKERGDRERYKGWFLGLRDWITET